MDVKELEAQIAQQLADLQEKWSERDSLIDEMRALRFMENEIFVPAELEADIVRAPIAYQIIERMSGALFGGEPAIKVPALSETDTEQERTSRLERWTAAALYYLQRQAGQDIVEAFGESLLADGHGAMRMLYAPRIWRDYPRRRKDVSPKDYDRETEQWKRGQPLPIVWTWLDPKTVYPLYTEYGLEAVIEHGERDTATIPYETFNRVKEDPEIWETAIAPSKGGPVHFTQRWMADGSLAYLVNGTIVHYDKKTRYRRPPYVYAFGIATSRREPAYLGLSTLYPLRNLLPYLDRLLTQKATAIRIWAWPTPVLQAQIQRPLGPDGLPVPIEIEPGKSITLLPGESISFLVWQGAGPDIDRMTEFVYHLAERAGIADVLYGSSDAGSSGYLISQLMAAAKSKFRPIVSHCESAMEDMIRILWGIVADVIGQNLYLFKDEWLKISPSDVAGRHLVQYHLNPVIPTDEYARSSMTINEVAAGLRSRRSGMERIGIEQPDDEERAILVERWKATPQVQEWLTKEALKRAGMLLVQEQMAKPEEVQNQGLPPALVKAILGASVPREGSVLQEETPPAVPLQAAPGVMAVPKAPGDRTVQPSGQRRGRPIGPHKGSEE